MKSPSPFAFVLLVLLAAAPVADEIRNDSPIIPISPSEIHHGEEDNVAMDDDFKGFEEQSTPDTEDDEDDF